MRRLNSSAALMLRLDRGNAYNHTLKIAVLDPSTDPQGWSRPRMQQIMRERIHLLPVFRQRCLSTPFGIHQPIWVDDPEFDLDAHVRYVACPAPGGMKEFCALVEQVYANPLDRGRPLWQLWVVEGLEGDRVALVTLFHHAYTDGIGAIGMMENVFSDVPEATPARAAGGEPRPLPPPSRRLGWAFRDLPALLRQSPITARGLRERVRIEREIACARPGLAPSSMDRSAAGPFQCGLSRNRRFACESFSLPELREISAAFGVTINDVFLSCVAGSVRRLLRDAGSVPDGPMVGSKRLSPKPLAERPSPGNYTSMDYVWLHTEIADPVERLRESGASAKATKEHFAATKDADLSKIIEIVPGPLVSALVWANEKTDGRYSPFKNIGVSNVPGPRRSLYLGQWKLDRWFSTGQVAHGAVLNFTVWSYGDQFNLGVLADAQAVADVWPLVEGFRASLDELLEAAGAGPSPNQSPVTSTQS